MTAWTPISRKSYLQPLEPLSALPALTSRHVGTWLAVTFAGMVSLAVLVAALAIL